MEIRLLASKRDALFRKFNKNGSRTIYNEFLRQLQLVEERTERAICTFMCNKLSDALEDNKNFWKEMRKLGPLPTTDDALNGFSPDELNTYFSAISASSQEDPPESSKLISTISLNRFTFQPVTANDVILAVAYFKSQGRGDGGISHSIFWLRHSL